MAVVGTVVGRGDAVFFPDVCLGPVAEVFEDCVAAAAFFVDDGDPAAALLGIGAVFAVVRGVDAVPRCCEASSPVVVGALCGGVCDGLPDSVAEEVTFGVWTVRLAAACVAGVQPATRTSTTATADPTQAALADFVPPGPEPG